MQTNPSSIETVRTDLAIMAYELSALRLQLAARRYCPELKFRPDQSRIPGGTREGGRFANETGAGAGQSSQARGAARSGLRRVAAAAVANPEAAAAMGAGAALPVAAAAAGVSRAAGLAAHYGAGQAITPFLHIPYDDPLQTEITAASNNAKQSEQVQGAVDDECDKQLEEDDRQCQLNAAMYGRNTRDARRIAATCRATAIDRYSECLTRGGTSGVTTQLYTGTRNSR